MTFHFLDECSDAFLQGQDATVTLRTGEVFTGVFSGASLESNEPRYILKMVKCANPPSQHQSNGVSDTSDVYIGEGEDHKMAFEIQDTTDLSVSSVSLQGAETKSNGKHNLKFVGA